MHATPAVAASDCACCSTLIRLTAAVTRLSASTEARSQKNERRGAPAFPCMFAAPELDGLAQRSVVGPWLDRREDCGGENQRTRGKTARRFILPRQDDTNRCFTENRQTQTDTDASAGVVLSLTSFCDVKVMLCSRDY